MPRLAVLLAPLTLACLAAPAMAAEAAENPLIDYDGFLALTKELAETREAHRISWPEFIDAARAGIAILLDTRSASAFAAGHIEGALNLPFSDFTDETLLAVLGPDKTRPVLIYCNNNFADDVAPVPLKRVELALNIPTFINLHGYGYTNVWELADVVTTGEVPWVSNELALAH